MHSIAEKPCTVSGRLHFWNFPGKYALHVSKRAYSPKLSILYETICWNQAQNGNDSKWKGRF
jgi:hypothetical protein